MVVVRCRRVGGLQLGRGGIECFWEVRLGGWYWGRDWRGDGLMGDGLRADGLRGDGLRVCGFERRKEVEVGVGVVGEVVDERGEVDGWMDVVDIVDEVDPLDEPWKMRGRGEMDGIGY